MGLRAVVFDLFDTLIDGRPRSHDRVAHLPTEVVAAFGEVWNEWGPRRTTSNVTYGELLDEVYRRAGRAPDREVIGELVARRAVQKRSQLTEIGPEVLAMVDDCRARGLRVAVVSGCAVDDVTAWDQSPLAQRVDAPVFSFDIGVNKPHPSIYQAALAQLHVSASEVAFVDDQQACLDGAALVGVERLFRAAWFVDRGETEPPAATPSTVTRLSHPSELSEDLAHRA